MDKVFTLTASCLSAAVFGFTEPSSKLSCTCLDHMNFLHRQCTVSYKKFVCLIVPILPTWSNVYISHRYLSATVCVCIEPNLGQCHRSSLLWSSTLSNICQIIASLVAIFKLHCCTVFVIDWSLACTCIAHFCNQRGKIDSATCILSLLLLF